jgi:hypothetical protein
MCSTFPMQVNAKGSMLMLATTTAFIVPSSQGDLAEVGGMFNLTSSTLRTTPSNTDRKKLITVAVGEYEKQYDHGNETLPSTFTRSTSKATENINTPRLEFLLIPCVDGTYCTIVRIMGCESRVVMGCESRVVTCRGMSPEYPSHL